MPKRKSPTSDDENEDYEYSEDDQPKTDTKKKQAPKATEQPLTIKKPKIGSSDSQSPTGSKKKSNHDNDVEVFSSSEGEQYVQLGQKKRVTVREFKGKKGICLNQEQWACLKKSIDTIDSLFVNSKK